MAKKNELNQKFTEKEYLAIIKQVKSKPPILNFFFWAFLVGSFIYLVGQLLFHGFLTSGLSQKSALSATIGTMVFIGSLLTGLGIYDNLAKFAGAGATTPVSGFGHSLAQGTTEAVRSNGLMEALSCGLRATAIGISLAFIFGYIKAVIFRPVG